MLVSKPSYSANYMYRSLRSVDEFSGGYRYEFSAIEVMARYPDARMIFQSLEIFNKYVEEIRGFAEGKR
jgi:hypothetical protein